MVSALPPSMRRAYVHLPYLCGGGRWKGEEEVACVRVIEVVVRTDNHRGRTVDADAQASPPTLARRRRCGTL